MAEQELNESAAARAVPRAMTDDALKAVIGLQELAQGGGGGTGIGGLYYEASFAF